MIADVPRFFPCGEKKCCNFFKTHGVGVKNVIEIILIAAIINYMCY